MDELASIDAISGPIYGPLPDPTLADLFNTEPKASEHLVALCLSERRNGGREPPGRTTCAGPSASANGVWSCRSLRVFLGLVKLPSEGFPQRRYDHRLYAGT
jgi:hypothetical protein